MVFALFILGLNEKSKGNDAYIDLLAGNNRLDKNRQEKLKRFREFITSKLSVNDDDNLKNDDNRIVFNIPWKENGDFQLDDPDYQRYLRALNASIFLRAKYLYERCSDLAISNHLKCPEKILYNETLVHLSYYSKLSSYICLGFENFVQTNSAFKQWLSLASTNDHHPLVIIGNRASGKTLLCTKLVQHLLNTLGKQTQCMIRYFNLTSRSRNISEVFKSICSQMKSLQNIPSLNNDSSIKPVEYYQSVLKSLSTIQKPLIIMIDGIEEAAPPSQQASSLVYYQALLQTLPPKVFI